MNIKTVKQIAVGVLVALLLFFVVVLYKTCKEKNIYAEKVRQNEQEIATLRGNIDSINTQWAKQQEYWAGVQKRLDAEVAQHQADQEAAKRERAKILGTIATLTTEVQPLIDANPNLKALIDAYKSALAVDALQIAAVEGERDSWIQKFNAKSKELDDALLAKANMQASLEKCLTGFAKANQDLATAGRTISHQRTLIKIMGIGGGASVAALTVIVVAGLVHK
jgi:chromosome segregation ATPase